jgi:photoactive yellow protein
MDPAALEATAQMSVAALETAEFGGIIVDRDGTIQQYNAYESSLAQLDAARVVGKNFFHEVAPCTANSAFEGRFLEFLELDDVVSESFAYFFPFKHGEVHVLVTLVKRTGAETVLIVIERVDPTTTAPLLDIYSVVLPPAAEH